MLCAYNGRNQGKKKPFRFFNMWAQSPTFLETVKKVWERHVHGCLMCRVRENSKYLKSDLKQLNREGFSEIQVKVAQAFQNFRVQNLVHKNTNNIEYTRKKKGVLIDRLMRFTLVF